MADEILIQRLSRRDLREYATREGDYVIARQVMPGQWLVTATANDRALTQVQGTVLRNVAGFAHRQWESDIDGQQHESLLAALKEAVHLARQRADAAAFAATQPCPQCETIKAQGGFGPNHRPSPRCESGKRPHCTCDICF